MQNIPALHLHICSLFSARAKIKKKGERMSSIIYEYCFSLRQLAASVLIHKAETNYTRDMSFTGRPEDKTYTKELEVEWTNGWAG